MDVNSRKGGRHELPRSDKRELSIPKGSQCSSGYRHEPRNHNCGTAGCSVEADTATRKAEAPSSDGTSAREMVSGNAGAQSREAERICGRTAEDDGDRSDSTVGPSDRQ